MFVINNLMKKRTKKPDAGIVLINAVKTGKMFSRTLPNILAVILLSGLFIEFIPVDRISAFMGGGQLTNALVGAAFGSISTGNPLISYLLGGELLNQGISIITVTALLVSWVTVGSIQLPAEMQSFGLRFALVRNILSFLFALVIAWLTVTTMQIIGATLG